MGVRAWKFAGFTDLAVPRGSQVFRGESELASKVALRDYVPGFGIL